MNRTIKTAFIIDTVMASGLAASVFLPSISIAIAFAASGLLFFIGLGFGVAALGKRDVPIALQILGLLGPFLAFLPLLLAIEVASRLAL